MFLLCTETTDNVPTLCLVPLHGPPFSFFKTKLNHERGAS